MQHFSAEQLDRYKRRATSPGEWLTLHDHLASCVLCRDAVSATLLIDHSAIRDQLFENVSEQEHLTYDELEAVADDRPSDGIDQEIRYTHLLFCSPCNSDIQELRAFRAKLEQGSSSRTEVGVLPPARAVDRRVARASVWALAAAAAIAIVAGLAAYRGTRSGREPIAASDQVVETHRQTPAPMPVQTVPRVPLAAVPRTPEMQLALEDVSGAVGVDTSGAVVGLDRLTTSERASVAKVLATGRLPRSAAVDRVRRTRGVLLGPPGSGISVKLLHPVGVVLDSPIPTFRWTAVSGAKYAVSIYDSEYLETASSGPIEAVEWTVPTALKRGQTYSWQLTITVGDHEFKAPVPPAPEARFEILSEKATAHLKDVRTRSKGSHLVMSVAYAEAGLLHRARQELTTLIKLNPASPIAKKLLADLSKQN